MNELINSLYKSKDWSLYFTDSNTYVYSMSTYNYVSKHRCTIYVTIVFTNDKLEQIKNVSIEESWEENLDIKSFKIAILNIDCKIEIIDEIIKSYLSDSSF